MHTTAFWLTVPEPRVPMRCASARAAIDALRGIGARAGDGGALALMCDPRDLGQTLGSRERAREGPPAQGWRRGFDPTLFLYDNVPGGVGLAERIYEQRDELLLRARRLLESCPCEEGCPACVGPAAGATPGNAPVEPFSRKRLGLDVLSALGVAGMQ